MNQLQGGTNIKPKDFVVLGEQVWIGKYFIGRPTTGVIDQNIQASILNKIDNSQLFTVHLFPANFFNCFHDKLSDKRFIEQVANKLQWHIPRNGFNFF